MAKKSRRTRAKQKSGRKAPQRSPGIHVQTSQARSESKASVSTVESPTSAMQVTRYQYVLPELRRIGIIAGALFLILIVLTFILG